MSLGMTITLAIIAGGFCLFMYYLKMRADTAARQAREDLVQLLKERRPTLEHTLERLGNEKK